MGLDWNPGNRPKPGFEAEFEEIIRRMDKGRYEKEKSALGRFIGRFRPIDPDRQPTRQELLQRYNEISTTAFETLNAPRVGYDDPATRWARNQYAKQGSAKSEQEWLESLHGFYVLDLVEDVDGLPRYTNGSPGGYVESFSFRAKFLQDCVEVLGLDLIDELYQMRTSSELIVFGQQFMKAAEDFAREEGLDLANPDAVNQEPELDIVLSAARWCLFWGERGHFLDPDW